MPLDGMNKNKDGQMFPYSMKPGFIATLNYHNGAITVDDVEEDEKGELRTGVLGKREINLTEISYCQYLSKLEVFTDT